MSESFETNSEAEQPKYPDIAQEIIEMGLADRVMRDATKEDMAKWDAEVDRRNTRRLKEIIEQIGWPSKNLVGKDASHYAWLLAQHADADLEFQERCLGLLSDLPEDEAQPENVAFLTDRTMVAKDEKQLYGTQFHIDTDDGRAKPWPIEDMENLDARRGAAGLEPFADYEAHMVANYSRQSKNNLEE